MSLGDNKPDELITLTMDLLEDGEVEQVALEQDASSISQDEEENNSLVHRENTISEDVEAFLNRCREWFASEHQVNVVTQPQNQVQPISQNTYKSNNREKNIEVILNFIKTNFLFIKASGSLLLWKDGSYNPMPEKEFLTFCRQNLPDGFQRAEFQLEKGFVDIISPRNEQRELLSRLIDFHPAQ